MKKQRDQYTNMEYKQDMNSSISFASHLVSLQCAIHHQWGLFRYWVSDAMSHSIVVFKALGLVLIIIYTSLNTVQEKENKLHCHNLKISVTSSIITKNMPTGQGVSLHKLTTSHTLELPYYDVRFHISHNTDNAYATYQLIKHSTQILSNIASNNCLKSKMCQIYSVCDKHTMMLIVFYKPAIILHNLPPKSTL